jgi:hypothetical protein
MRVLVVKPSGGAFSYITKSFINAFNDVGFKAAYWDGKDSSFKNFNPDLYIGCSGHRQEVPGWFKGKIAIHVNPFGDMLEPINNVNINEPEQAIEWVVDQNPDVVFGYGLDEDGKTYWKKWKSECNINFIGVPTAGDATIYYPDRMNVDYKIAFLGGRWPYKGHNINKWLLPVIEKFKNKIAIKGWGGWNGVKQYRGPLPNGESGRKFLSSALVGPCVCEPHTTKYGIDIPERFFKVALCGSLPILDRISGFNRYCDNYVMANDPKEYVKLILNYSCNKDYVDEGINLAKKIRKEVLSKHTYFNRMRNLCDFLEFNNASEIFNDKIIEIRQSC